jgi:hypothetical protein
MIIWIAFKFLKDLAAHATMTENTLIIFASGNPVITFDSCRLSLAACSLPLVSYYWKPETRN